MQVVKKGKTSGKKKGERCTHQATGQATVQWCPGGEQPRHRYQWREISERETAACTDSSLVQSTGRIGALWRQRADAPLATRLAELKARLHGARPIGQQVDGLRGVISRCQKRLAEAEIAKVEAEATIIKETEDIANYKAQLAELEPLLASSAGGSQGRWTGQRDARAAGPRCAVEWNVGQYYRHVRCVESREQARGQCRLATEHEQCAAHNEDDDGRDAATRGHQGSTAVSASSGGGATKAHVPDAGGLNITGRMAELDNLFSEADYDIIAVQESRLPQT